MGFYGPHLETDGSWNTEEGSSGHFPRWFVFSDGRWTVTGQWSLPALRGSPLGQLAQSTHPYSPQQYKLYQEQK